MFNLPRNAWSSSPIDRLPVELLSYIFTLGTHSTDSSLDDDDERSPPFTTESIKTPLIISSVNHHWRSIARNTPSLWTSLCITVEMIDVPADDGLPGRSTFNTRPLKTCLALSRNYPLDILIDARDQDWDFSEPEIPSEYECDTYTPPFSSAHISTAITLLLPHLPRWRSLDILTDSWAPMFIALQHIQAPLLAFGAPLLESLTLMRCNDFVSYGTTFQPHEMKGPAFLHSYNTKTNPAPLDILPRLRNLTLRGVHVDWSSLASILSHSHTGLRTLELSSHCAEVRPSVPEFHRLLTVNPSLHKLIINGSGPYIPDDLDDSGSVLFNSLGAVSLLHLRDISLGYRSAFDGQTILELLDAPNARALTLEDSTHPGEPEDVDAGCLLTFVGTGEFYDSREDCIVAYTVGDGLPYEVSLDKEPTTPTRRRESGACANGSPVPQAAFPLLESVTLKGVKSYRQPLQAFFGALQNLRQLELSGMSMQAVSALLPRGQAHTPSRTAAMGTACPCPQLQSLCLKGFSQLPLPDLDFVVGGLAIERLNKGACGLREVNIHVDSTSGCGPEDFVSVLRVGAKVRIFKEVLLEEGEEEGWDGMLCDEDTDVDPFKAGGVFNDPDFDAYYAGRALAR